MIRRGHIYFVDLAGSKGREQAGLRPVLVVSADAINAQPLVVTVVVGTAGVNVERDYPVNVRVTAAESGLPRDTVFLCFQIRSLDPARFRDEKTGALRLAGSLPVARMVEVEKALGLVLSIPS